MPESNHRAPEVQSIILRPLDVAGVLYKYRPKRPGEVIDEDDIGPGYGRLPDPAPPSAQQPKKLYFTYTDEAGIPLSREVRLERPGAKKKTWQEAADPDRPGQWVTGEGCMTGVRSVPFWLPGVIAALKAGETIFIVEGPKKCGPLHEWDLAATCNIGGSSNAKVWREHAKEFFLPLFSSSVVVMPDRDGPGIKSAAIIADALASVGVAVSILDLPVGPKGDIIDWIGDGGTRQKFLDLVETEARAWTPSERIPVNSEAFARNGPQHREQGPPAKRDQKKPPSRVIGAGSFMRSYEPISYTLNGILPSGYLYGITAKQGSGKTAFMIAAALAVAFGREDIIACAVERGRVAYVTIENPVDFKMKLAVNCFVHNVSYDEAETRIAIIDGRDTPEQIFDGLRLDAEVNGGFQLVCFETFQAGFAAANVGAFNDNEAVLGYLIRLRPLTSLPGLPSVTLALHPTKNAGESELIPYGGGSTLNEIDGNLTLWKEGTIKLHHNRLRGPEFQPRFFRIEQLSCPDIVDKGGRQILLPVLRPTTEMDVEERAIVSRNTKLELLRAMLAEPKGTQRDWATKTNLSPSTVNEKLKALEREKLVKKILDAWVLTPNGRNLAKS